MHAELTKASLWCTWFHRLVRAFIFGETDLKCVLFVLQIPRLDQIELVLIVLQPVDELIFVRLRL